MGYDYHHVGHHDRYLERIDYFMAMTDPRNVQHLNADGSDTISQFPAVQRNNAARLSEALTTSTETVALNTSFRNASGLIQRIGKLRILSLEFRATSDAVAATRLLANNLAASDRPTKTIYAALAGANDLNDAVGVRARLGTDGTVTCPVPTIMQSGAYYGGQIVWVVA